MNTLPATCPSRGLRWRRLTKARRRLGVTFLALLVSSGVSAAARAGDDPASDIRTALQQWRAEFNARRPAHICDLFAADLLYDFQGLPEQNYPLLCARLHRALADHTKTFQYGLRIKEIIVSGSLAVVRLTWISTVTTANGHSATNDEPGLDVFQRQSDGRWQIIRYIAYQED
jgi:steroid delta-isomerase